jgi:hypothetical protein
LPPAFLHWMDGLGNLCVCDGPSGRVFFYDTFYQ